ncbi:hypothetical protein JZ751_013395 [Albula glossodonta]|uniref:Uncharacterized protein n=1 Tax=Albula glossodonta TaxID=121402 RepID=A0A8T2N9H4_9TELE|nr:hypothetical protein JZ751_013395 [Albula glossodonta]
MVELEGQTFILSSTFSMPSEGLLCSLTEHIPSLSEVEGGQLTGSAYSLQVLPQVGLHTQLVLVARRAFLHSLG